MDPRQAQLFKVEFQAAEGPFYHRISRVIGLLVEREVFHPGDLLPPQRELAKLLGIDFTTVTRGYDNARALGLTSAKRGQGTFISLAAPSKPAACAVSARQVIDLSSVWPPNQQLIHALAAQSRQLIDQKAFGFLGQRKATTTRDLEAGTQWLKAKLANPAVEQVVASSGTRNALLSILTMSGVPQRTLLIEEAVWPTVRVIADQVGIRCVPVPMDEQGLIPAALGEISGQTGARFVYCVPNLHNPSSRSMSLERRLELARMARELGLTIIEDDVYGALISSTPPALYDLAPGHVYYVAGLTKCISPSLRVAYVACPTAESAARLNEVLRLSMQAPSSFESALAARMILSGTAHKLVDQLRAETKVRQHKSVEQLRPFKLRWHEEGMFIQVLLPDGVDEVTVRDELLALGVKIAIGRTFSATGEPSIRVATGSVSRGELHEACAIIGATLGRLSAREGRADAYAPFQGSPYNSEPNI
jgi:DNA-binding transcriptional MocR family regulator